MSKIFTTFLPIIMAASISQTAISEEQNIDTYISKAAQEACIEYGEEYGICPELLMAIAETESGGKATAQNGACKGLMQVSEKWHKDRMKKLGVTDLFDEQGNILVGTDYLSELFDEYGDTAYVLDVYNGNSGAKSNYTNGVISPYAKKILERSEELERLHDLTTKGNGK